MGASASEKISPTAHATGAFWHRHGLSHPGLVTARGRRLDRAFGLLIAATKRLSGVSLDALMLARHLGIDARLTQAIESGRVQQVIEIAAGLSPRGWRFKQRYGERLRYVETDLPAMTALKRQQLQQAGLMRPGHEVIELDALRVQGHASLAAIAARLDPKQGTAIITEGLMNYLDPASAEQVWRQIAETLARFPHGVYLADAYLRREHRSAALKVFGGTLQAFVRGRMHVHFATPEEAIARLRAFGFAEVAVRETRDIAETRDLALSAPGADRVRVLEAWR